MSVVSENVGAEPPPLRCAACGEVITSLDFGIGVLGEYCVPCSDMLDARRERGLGGPIVLRLTDAQADAVRRKLLTSIRRDRRGRPILTPVAEIGE